MAVGSLGIRQSTTYFLGKKIFSENEIKTAVTQIWFLTSIISICTCFFLITQFSKSGGNLLWVILALIPIPFSLFNTYNSGIFLGKNEISAFNKINWIPALLVLLLTALFLLVFSLDVTGYLLAVTGGPIFVFVVLLIKNKFIEAFSLKLKSRVLRKILGLGLVYAFTLFIINLNYRLDVILLDNLNVAYETGIYTKGSAIAQYLWQIPMLFGTIVFARSAVSKNDLLFSYKVAQLLRISFVFMVICSFILWMTSELVVVGLFGEEFRGSIMVLKYLLPGVVLLTVFKVMNTDLAGKGMPWVALKAMLPALAINIVLNLLWIPESGADGAALASTVSYSFAAIVFLYFYSKAVGIPIKDILHFKKTDFKPIFILFKRSL